MIGLNSNKFTVLHLDNLEQYAKHARDPSKALTSTLIIGAQQPLPNDPSMKLKESIDRQGSLNSSPTVGISYVHSQEEDMNVPVQTQVEGECTILDSVQSHVEVEDVSIDPAISHAERFKH